MPTFPKSLPSIQSFSRDPLRRSSSLLCRNCLRRRAQSQILQYRFSSTQRPGFKPAETWDGLEWVSTPEWFLMHHRPNISQEAYPRKTQITDPHALSSEIRKAVIELCAYSEHGMDLKELDTLPTDFVWPHGVALRLSKKNEPVIEYEDTSIRARFLGLLEIGEPDGPSESHAEVLVAEAATDDPVSAAEQEDWKSMRLADLEWKLALIKRIMRRTGVIIGDCDISKANTVFDLHKLITTPKKKAPKLVEVIREKGELAKLPNVAISPRRVSRIDEDKRLGRWKLISNELNERGLPEFPADAFNWGKRR